MCGIFGVINDKSHKAAITTLEGLKKLEYRGYDSWGIALIQDNRKTLQLEKHIGKIGKAQTTLPQGDIALGHTRWATHGGVTDANAHPHLDCTQTIAVIHNGIVENYQTLKEDLRLKGHRFISETDTEVIAHAIEEERKVKPLLQAVVSVFNELVGSNAIGVLDLKEKTIIACRNGSPLVVGQGDHQYFLASDIPALLIHTRTIHFLHDGEGVQITQAGMKLFDLKTLGEKKLTLEHIDWEAEDAEKGGYPHFLLKEIMEQKKTILKTAHVNKKEILEIADKIERGYKTIMLACGGAAHTAIAAQYFFADSGHEARAFGAYEFLPHANLYGKKTIALAISQSGETADTLIAAKKTKKNGSEIVAIVNARSSTLERLSDHVIPVGAGPEIAVVSTKAFTSQLSTLYLLSRSVVNQYEGAVDDIEHLSVLLNQWMTQKLQDQIIELAKFLLDKEHVYIIGKHYNYPAALEFALKLKESSYTHAEAFAAGELKHGVLALIQKGTPCFVLAQNDEVKDEVLSSAAELKARGGTIIGVAPFKTSEFDYHIQTPDAGKITLFGNIIVGQLLGYYLGIGRGADPDKPRNLAKSVTVK